MSTLAEMPGVMRTSSVATVLPPPSRGTYVVGLLAALGIHAAILFLWPQSPPVIEQVEFGVEVADASVEVTLVAALPAEEPVAVVEPPPEPVPPPPPEPMPEPPPITEPPPVEPIVKAEMTLPEPEPVPPPPVKREKPRVERKEAPKPRPVARPERPVGDGSSAVPGNDATTAVRASGGDSAKPGYLRNPHPAYPEAARAAKQEGVVTLNVNVDAQGNVSGIRITRSSGFPLLDERARSTVAERWKFRPAKAGGIPIASNVSIPIRFTLNR